MDLKATKTYSEIVTLLDSLEARFEAEIKNFQQEFTQKYKLAITQEIMQYTTDFLKMKFNLTIKDITKDFNWFTIILDCSEMNLGMSEIEALIRRVNRKMKDVIPKEAETDEVQIILKKFLRRVICKIPSTWTQPIALNFVKQFGETLAQLGIEIA
jgi:hypothetical protein